MAKPLQDRLYNLLPAIYRIQDAKSEQGEALRALMALIEQQYLALEADVDQLYDDWFIETCQEWLVPYLGDLLGVQPLQGINHQVSSQRAYVAHTLAYRQRKGTASVLEQLARDVTNWPACVVEYFNRLATTQNLNHLRPTNHRTPNLRDTHTLEQLGSPFETANHWPEIRRITNGRGRYNLPNVGLWLWRLQAYPLQWVRAKAVDDNPALGLYWCNPLGQDQPLFNAPNPETVINQLSKEVNLPTPLRRRPLHDEIEALVAGEPTVTDYFDRTPPIQISLDGVPVLPQHLVICDLSGEPDGSSTGWRRPTLSQAPYRRIALDPVLGRLAVPQDQSLPASVQISYAYGFSGDLGGGPYDRRASIDPALLQRVNWQVGVSQTLDAVDGEIIHPSLADAVAAWNLQSASQELTGVIVLLDNNSYDTGTTPPIQIGAGRELLIVAADWPALAMPGQMGRQERRVGQLSPQGRRVHLQGDLQVRGTADADSQNPGRILLNGLLLEGRLTVQPGHLGNLQIDHCTLLPAAGGLTVQPAPTVSEPKTELTNHDLQVQIGYSITGPLYLASTVAGLSVSDSLVDGSQAGQVLVSAPINLPVDGEVQIQTRAESFEPLRLVANDPASLQTELATKLTDVLAEAQVALAGTRLVVAGPSGNILNFEADPSGANTVDLLGLDVLPAAIASPDPNFAAPPTTLTRCTIFGSTYTQALILASEVLFTATVVTQRQQVGCVRFSYVPPGSQVPRLYRCQPDLATTTALEQARQTANGTLPPDQAAILRDRIHGQLVPSFTTSRYGDPAYGQLSQVCPEEIRQGAEDGSEMGAFSFLKQPQRESNLRLTFDQYLRFGLEAGIFFAT
jgi:hypothetical protein